MSTGPELWHDGDRLDADLRAQAKAHRRAGYDGHNRRPLRTTMRQLRNRRRRRRVRSGLAKTARSTRCNGLKDGEA